MNTSNNRRRTHAQALAASTGLDTWKTYAGRAHGDDNFELLDVYLIAKKILSSVTSTALLSECPVCLTSPSSTEEWYITQGCRHAVCLECFRQYSAVQVRDFGGGNLKLCCPVCLLVLRETDVIVALAHDKEIIDVLDQKMRDQHLLREAPNYRQCPHCVGGGFVTPSCLALNANRQKSTEPLLDSIDETFRCFILFLLLMIPTSVWVPNAKFSTLALLLTAFWVWRKAHKTQLQQARLVVGIVPVVLVEIWLMGVSTRTARDLECFGDRRHMALIEQSPPPVSCQHNAVKISCGTHPSNRARVERIPLENQFVRSSWQRQEVVPESLPPDG